MVGNRWWAALVGCVIVLAGCGGSDDPLSATSAVATIGSDGGRVGAEAVVVLIPPGAMAQDTTVRIAADSTGSPPLPSWTRAAGDMLQLTPHGSEFAEPVTVRLRAPAVTLAANERLMIAKAQPGGAWEVLGDTQLVGDQLEVQVRSFSYFIPVVVKFDPVAVSEPAPFDMSAVSFTCDGAACASPVLLTSTAVTASSSGNGGALPAGCINPTVQLRYQTTTLKSLPATPTVVLSHLIPWNSLQGLYTQSGVNLGVSLSCIDAATNTTSLLALAGGTITVDSFSSGPTTPIVRRFPTALTRAPGETVTLAAVLTRGASYRTSFNTFKAPTDTDAATVYLERLTPGAANWAIAMSRTQTTAHPSPTGAAAWAYWGFDFALGPVTALDNGTQYRLRACYQAPTATVTACNIGPVATLTVLQQTLAPTVTQQPASVLVQPGQTANFSASAAGTPTPTLQWQTRAVGETDWMPASGGSGATTGNFTTATVGLADNGRQFRLVAGNAAGEVASAAVTLSVGAAAVAPTIAAQPASLTVVAGSEAVFAVAAQGTAALSYQWQRNGVALPGANAAQLKLPAVTAGDAAAYTVRIGNSAGTVLSEAAVLTVNAVPATAPAAPAIVTQPAAVAVNEGNVATFAVGVSGSGAMSFQWYRNGQAIPGANAAAYTIAAVTLAQAGNYHVMVSHAAGSVTSQAATLGVAPAVGGAVAPTITTQPVSVVVLPMSTTTLAVAVTGSGPLTYQWFQDGAPLSGSNGPTLTFGSLDAISNGQYTVTVSNAVGSVSSTPAQLLVVGAPQITAQPTATSVSKGADATFSVQASGNALRFQWVRNGIAIDGATSASYSTPALTLADSGAVYTVIVYNGAGLVTSVGAVLTVTAAGPPAPVTSVTGKLATGRYHTCAVTATHAAACWGENSGGQLGTGNTVPAYAPFVWTLPEPVQRVAAGFTMSCALTATTGRVYCSGGLVNAQVPTEVPALSGVIEIAAGAVHACALKADGTVWCWGGNNQYELGNGTTLGSFAPVQVLAAVGVPLTGVVAIDASERHTCAVRDVGAGAVHCWGANNDHQLGYSPFSAYAGEPGFARAVPGLDNVAQVVAGSGHSCARSNDGTVRCWGLNNWGQLGIGSIGPVSEPVTAPTVVPGLSGVLQLGAGIRHNCALLSGGTLRCWGSGFLGNAYVEYQSTPLAVNGLGDALALDAGDDHSCVQLSGGALRCWGSNVHGQYGNGNNTSSNTPVAAGVGLSWWQP